MELYVIIIFVIGYLLIALEHPIRINKAATALVTGVLCWTVFALADPGPFIKTELSELLSSISSILFFLLGAMTIVELIDAHQGFRFITDRIRTTDVRRLMWVVSWLAFFLSAVLDNLTTAIVMVSLTRKLVHDRDQRLIFCGMIIIAANAGGAWSPIGDVTTTMLWIGGQISSSEIIVRTFLPGVACLLVPLTLLSFKMTGQLTAQPVANDDEKGSKLILVVGLAALLFVPVFKTITHLPPYMGIMLGLGVLWVISEMKNPDADESERRKFSAAHALSKIDTSSVLFFMGILLAVGALESMEILHHFAAWLDESLGDNRIIISLIGVVSAIVDNVPLVAACMGMYSLDVYPMDHMIWQYLAYCAGTGGSLLVIGSAAGVAVMGMERIDFLWYMKKISLLALAGYVSGAAVYLLMN
ncbi:MAG TPA: sodium:proton antiporter NhaD [Cyclobacteriaceae bacterium]|nr:sodium:proton antiporter NhaD [Cyclobacteriaceae bacterium]